MRNLADLRSIIDRRLGRDHHAWVSDYTLKDFGLTPEAFLQWCKEEGYEVQPPLIAGGLFEVRSGRSTAA